MVSRVSLATPLLVIAVDPSAAAPTCGSDAFHRLVRRLGVTDAEVASAVAGRVVTRDLESREAGDLTIAAVLYVRAPMPQPLERLAEIRQLLTVGAPLQSGLFSDPPQLEDLAELRFSARELEDARGCEPRDCSLKLDEVDIGRIGRVRWDSPQTHRRVAALLKESMLDALLAYRRDGSLPVYLDKKEPVSVSDELRWSLARSRYVDIGSPFLQYVLDYPNAALADTWNVFYWSSQKLRKPIASVHHLVIHREADGDAVCYAIADKHVSDNHYFRAWLDLLWLLPGRDSSGFFCVRLSCARVDLPRWFSGIAMHRIRRAARRSLDSQLRAARLRIEASPDRGATDPRTFEFEGEVTPRPSRASSLELQDVLLRLVESGPALRTIASELAKLRSRPKRRSHRRCEADERVIALTARRGRRRRPSSRSPRARWP